MIKNKTKQVTEAEIQKAFDSYLQMLYDDSKISATKFNHMQTAIVGCKYLINDIFGTPRKRYYGQTK